MHCGGLVRLEMADQHFKRRGITHFVIGGSAKTLHKEKGPEGDFED